MKASDLRIGNYVQPSLNHKAAYGENVAFITLIQEDRFTVCNHYPGKWFESIPLTEEWLLKLGFEKGETTRRQGNGYDWKPDNVYTDTTLYELSENIKYRLETWTWGGGVDNQDAFIFYDDVLIKCEYVHQLQNLYYALTGEELTIKEPVTA